MMLTAFDGKFHETKDEIPPGACRPLKKVTKNNVEKVDPQKSKSNIKPFFAGRPTSSFFLTTGLMGRCHMYQAIFMAHSHGPYMT